MDPQTQQQAPAPIQQPTNDSFVDPTQRRGGFSIHGLVKNKLLLLIILVVIAFVVAGGLWYVANQEQRNYEQAQKNLDEAKEAYSKGDIKTVQEKLLASYNKYPKDPKFQAALIEAIAVEGNLTGTEQEAFEKAKPYVKEALETNRGSAEVLIAVGYINEIVGNYNEALGFYDEALSIDKNNAEGWFHKGHVLEFLGRNDEAFTAYKQAYAIDPNNPVVIIGVARATIAEGKTEEAITLYKKVGELNEASADLKAEALTNASILKRNQILYMDEAIALSEQAVKFGPNFSPALAAHGYNLSVNGRFNEGVEFLKKSLTANPRISQNYYFLGVIYRSVNDLPNALIYIEQGLAKIDNDNTIVDSTLKSRIKGNMAYDLAKTYSRSNQNKNNLSLLQQAVQLNPNLLDSLKSDYASGNLFKELEQDPAFQQLIQ